MTSKDQQKQSNNVKLKLRTLKDAYKKVKDNNAKTETAPRTGPFYSDIDEILGTRATVKLPEVRELGVNEDDNINPSGSTISWIPKIH